mmetsp:Transcript_21792/g.53809  ORF Transcript_21792/g.53809 Transcript_21792/m.53809 type:complete len:304 (-) Transcript_21792:128-1039(-)
MLIHKYSHNLPSLFHSIRLSLLAHLLRHHRLRHILPHSHRLRLLAPAPALLPHRPLRLLPEIQLVLCGVVVLDTEREQRDDNARGDDEKNVDGEYREVPVHRLAGALHARRPPPHRAHNRALTRVNRLPQLHHVHHHHHEPKHRDPHRGPQKHPQTLPHRHPLRQQRKKHPRRHPRDPRQQPHRVVRRGKTRGDSEAEDNRRVGDEPVGDGVGERRRVDGVDVDEGLVGVRVAGDRDEAGGPREEEGGEHDDEEEEEAEYTVDAGFVDHGWELCGSGGAGGFRPRRGGAADGPLKLLSGAEVV